MKKLLFSLLLVGTFSITACSQQKSMSGKAGNGMKVSEDVVPVSESICRVELYLAERLLHFALPDLRVLEFAADHRLRDDGRLVVPDFNGSILEDDTVFRLFNGHEAARGENSDGHGQAQNDFHEGDFS